MSKFIQLESYVKQISCTRDIVDCLIRRREEANVIRKLASLEPIITYVINYDEEKIETSTLIQNYLEISDISIYYNLQAVSENGILFLKSTVRALFYSRLFMFFWLYSV